MGQTPSRVVREGQCTRNCKFFGFFALLAHCQLDRLKQPKIDEKTGLTAFGRPAVVFRRSTYWQSKVLDRLNTVLGRQGVSGYSELPKFPFFRRTGPVAAGQAVTTKNRRKYRLTGSRPAVSRFRKVRLLLVEGPGPSEHGPGSSGSDRVLGTAKIT